MQNMYPMQSVCNTRSAKRDALCNINSIYIPHIQRTYKYDDMSLWANILHIIGIAARMLCAGSRILRPCIRAPNKGAKLTAVV